MVSVNPLSMEFKSTQLNYPDGVGDERADSSFSKGFRRQNSRLQLLTLRRFSLCAVVPLFNSSSIIYSFHDGSESIQYSVAYISV